MKLFHGTTIENAEMLLKNGWNPKDSFSGSNGGQSKYLYVTNIPENALWFSEQKGESVILEITDISLDDLLVDPEDGLKGSVEEEISHSKNSGFPAYLVLFKPLGPAHFKRYS